MVTKEFLIEEYINKKIPYYKIAKIVGCDTNVIRRRLLGFGIPLRSMHTIMLGKKQSEETRQKKSKSLSGVVFSKERNAKISKSLKANKGRGLKISKSLKGKSKPKDFGAKIKGEKHYAWKGGITPLVVAIYNISGSWRKKVFERDDYTCQRCKRKGGKLEAHHIRKFVLLLEEFLRNYCYLNIEKDREQLIELAKSHLPFWEISNGKTLCCECHILEEKEQTCNVLKTLTK